MKKRFFLMTSILFLLISLVGCSWFTNPTIADIYQDYDRLAVDFQHKHYLLMTSVYPELKKVAAAERDEQILRRTLRTQRFLFLLETHPEKLTLDKGIMTLTNYDWTEQLDQKMIKVDPHYAELKTKLQDMIKENKKHPLTLEQREKIKNVFYRPEYIQLLKNMQQQVDDLDEQLKTVINAGHSVCVK